MLVLAYVLALQAFAIGLSLGSMAAAQAGSLAVICTSKGPLVIAPDIDPATDPRPDPHWPCSTICHLAATAPGLLCPEGEHLFAPPPGNVGMSAFAPAEAPRRALAGFVAEARAPPFSI